MIVLYTSWFPPQPGPENGSEELCGSRFRNCFGAFLAPPANLSLTVFLGTFLVIVLGFSWTPSQAHKLLRNGPE